MPINTLFQLRYELEVNQRLGYSFLVVSNELLQSLLDTDDLAVRLLAEQNSVPVPPTGVETIPGPDGEPNYVRGLYVEPEWVLAAPLADGEAYELDDENLVTWGDGFLAVASRLIDDENAWGASQDAIREG